MGTSSSSTGAGSSNPLIPSWIDAGSKDVGVDAPIDINNNSPETIGDETISSDNDRSVDNETTKISSGRYQQPRRDFNKYVKSKGQDLEALKRSFKGYVKNGSGGSSKLSKRMKPSASRIIIFHGVLNSFKASGKDQTLNQFQLASYTNKPLLTILSALADVVFADNGKPFENTQDDSITKQAYCNTITRISEIDGIDLDQLTNDNIEIMMAIFLEETISQRVICDIGNSLTELLNDIEALVEIESNVYQIVSGLVRNQIMPEIISTNRGDKSALDRKIENIYRIAFDAIEGTN